jgi:serine phosphatase RsbU (regulator of sigma subunit)
VSANPEIAELIKKCINEKQSQFYEAMNINKEGRELWLHTTLTPIMDEKGELKRLVVIDADVTERKQAEEIVKKTNTELAQKNKDITDSIHYARRIQQAILPSESEMKSPMLDTFVLFKPRDIVSGDFYWFTEKNNKVLIAAVDCTGHGVPGAFMSMIGHTLLNEIVNEKGITAPGEILTMLNEAVMLSLKQGKEDSLSKDGMDIALCSFDLEDNQNQMVIEYAGAMRPLIVVSHRGELTEVKPDKFSIGGIASEIKPFNNNSMTLSKGDMVYMFTDGYADQFGGKKGKKYMQKNMFDLLHKIASEETYEQKELLENTLDNWKKDLPQVDDVLVIGVRI